MVGEGNAFFASGNLCERAEAFAEPEGKGFGSWLFGVSSFELPPGFHLAFSRRTGLVSCLNFNVTRYYVYFADCLTLMAFPRGA